MTNRLSDSIVAGLVILAIAGEASALMPEPGNPATPADYGIATAMVGSFPILAHLKAGPGPTRFSIEGAARRS